MKRSWWLIYCFTAWVVAPAHAQGPTPTIFPVGPGPLIIRIVDAITGRPISFALVALDAPRVEGFTSEAGRFSVPKLGPGSHHARVRQLGYAPRELILEVEPGGPPGPIEVQLTARPLQLPTVEVTACLSSDELDEQTRLVLDEASENARRLDLLQRSYPFTSWFRRIRVVTDSEGRSARRIVDDMALNSTASPAYKPGRAVIESFGNTDVGYFTTTAVLSADFRRTHCFWIAGVDTTPEGPWVRLSFGPIASLTGPDWAGELAIDTTGVLRRSSARLVVTRSRKEWPQAASVAVEYAELAPSLLHEYHLSAQIQGGAPDYLKNQEKWILICFRFTSGVPGVQKGQPPDAAMAAMLQRACPEGPTSRR